MLRRGYIAFTYSDDFRIASPTLGAARAAVEACAEEVRELGLVLNDRKTYTYRTRKYRESLTSFTDAERRLFAEDRSDAEGDREDPFNLRFLGSDYGDADELVATSTLGVEPLDQGAEEDEALGEDVPTSGDLDERRIIAAERAWQLWLEEDESEETQAGQQASITQSLLGRALPTLGIVGNGCFFLRDVSFSGVPVMLRG
jgi:hypothetical protein